VASQFDPRNPKRDELRKQQGNEMRKRGDFDMASWKQNRTTPIRQRFDIATATNPLSKAANTRQRRRSGGGSVQQNDDGSIDAKNASISELRLALEQASREDTPSDRADAPPNQAAADFNETASYRTGQGVRDLKYRWGQGAQTGQRQQQPTANDIENQALQDHDPDQDDQDQQ
jgi:hypothetical protein